MRATRARRLEHLITLEAIVRAQPCAHSSDVTCRQRERTHQCAKAPMAVWAPTHGPFDARGCNALFKQTRTCEEQAQRAPRLPLVACVLVCALQHAHSTASLVAVMTRCGDRSGGRRKALDAFVGIAAHRTDASNTLALLACGHICLKYKI